MKEQKKNNFLRILELRERKVQ